MIEFSDVAIGDGGVLHCVRCGTSPAGVLRATDEVVSEIARVAQTWAEAPGPNVAFGGFEPFSHPSLPELIAEATAAGFERVMLRTDAGALARPGNSEGCLAAGVRFIEVVLLGDGPMHDELSGRPGLFAAASEGVGRFVHVAHDREVSVAVFGQVPACRHNVGRLPETVSALARMGAVAVRIDAAALKPSDSNAALLNAALDTATVNRMAATVVGWSAPVSQVYSMSPYSSGGAGR